MSSVFGTPSGSLRPARSFSASSMMPIERSVPAMVKRPRANSMSAARGFEHVRGDLLALLDHLGGRFDDGGAAVHDRLRAAGAAAGEQLVAVALQQPDALERHAELLGQHLRERRGVALAVVERAGDDRDGAVGLEADAAHLLRWRCGDFEEAAEAETAHLAALAALALALAEALHVRELERVLEHARESRRCRSSMPDAVLRGISRGRMWLRRRSSRRSMSISAAAASISRSM